MKAWKWRLGNRVTGFYIIKADWAGVYIKAAHQLQQYNNEKASFACSGMKWQDASALILQFFLGTFALWVNSSLLLHTQTLRVKQ